MTCINLAYTCAVLIDWEIPKTPGTITPQRLEGVRMQIYRFIGKRIGFLRNPLRQRRKLPRSPASGEQVAEMSEHMRRDIGLVDYKLRRSALDLYRPWL